MQKDTPKPYLHLSGRTILEHTIRQFLPLDGLEHVVVATSSEYLSDAKRILRSVKSSQIRVDCVVGGKKRQDSIYNALKEVADVDLVMVHDAVRPFVKLQHINKCCKVAGNTGAAVLGIPAKDTIKKVNDRQEVQETPERKYLWQTQTPQVFQKNLLIEAYESARKETFTGTDDSSLVERLGHTVKMVEGDQSNFKITYPLDLQLAELLIDKD